MHTREKCKKRDDCNMCDDDCDIECIDCNMCDDDCVIECTKCSGVGKIYQSVLLNDESECSECDASGKINCPDYEEDS